ncbi:hypothetical protein O9A_01363 [Bartonella koehlerae C-29]|uniref:Uncharacterized protein n=1 Tax=Bartonella koehlerae C-29 TaxID=1134510 RepID=A0A067W4S9_9HYPH|nr:hypothetical protein O9A_01363 [Bartonella koehlerae C-29]
MFSGMHLITPVAFFFILMKMKDCFFTQSSTRIKLQYQTLLNIANNF